MVVNLKKFLIFCFIFLVMVGWIFSGFPRIWQKPAIPPGVEVVKAAEYLSNPSFTGGTTGWTLTTTVYDSTYYQDTAGSVKTATAVGRNTSGTGSAEQTIGTNINSTDTVKLSLYWSKRCVAVNCAINTVQVDIAKPSAPTTWVTIWSDVSIPAFDGATAWAGPSNLDVSASFDESGQYKIRLYANLKNGNNTAAQSLAWFDNASLDVTAAANISVSVSDGVVTYGTMVAGSSKTTVDLTDTQTLTNNGDVIETFNIMGQNTACPWTLEVSSGTDQYVHQFCKATDVSCASPPTNYSGNELTTGYVELYTGVPVSGTRQLDLRIIVPDPSTCFGQQSVNVTIQAVQ